jgi:asparagine synthase (glutamine-hydrolysing)
MCGIAGWVDFHRDLRLERETAQAMTDTMSARGPDDEGLWLSEHAALGHRRLAVIDPPGGRQPMVEGDAVLTYSGELYNYRELRRELEAAGHAFRTQSDTEVVLRAYLQWGVDMLERFNGMYAFAIWDGRAQELLLVRDRLGIKPLYYYQAGDGLLFGSEPKAILANPLAKRVVDPLGLCGFLTVTQTADGRTILRDLFDLPPGHYARFSRAGLTKHCYWKLEARPHEDDLATTISKVRALLEDIVERQLVSDVPLCMLLSGGLDSSALTALAQRATVADGRGGVRSFSVDFPGYVETFQAEPGRETADRPFVHEVAAHVGCEHRDIVLETEQLWDAGVRSSVARAWDFPSQMSDLDISLYLLFRGVQEHSTVALSGEGADEIFGGYPWTQDQEALALPIFPWIAAEMSRGASSSSPAQSPLGLYSVELVDRLKPIEYVLERYSSSLAQVPRLDGESGEQARMREVAYLELTFLLRTLLERKDRMSMATGLEVRVPFCDHRLVEYVFNVPWSIKKCDDREKGLLRKATEDLLPQSVLQRRKSGFPTTQDVSYDVGLRRELKQILDGDAPVLPFVNRDAVRAVVEESVDERDSSSTRIKLDGIVRTNAWLEEYGADMSAL